MTNYWFVKENKLYCLHTENQIISVPKISLVLLILHKLCMNSNYVFYLPSF